MIIPVKRRSCWKMFKYRMYKLMWCTDLIGVRFFVGLGSILWGILLLWPGDTFGRPTYTLMAKYFDEVTWGIMFLIQGLVAMTALFLDIRKRSVLIIDGVLGCGLWTLSCISMLASVYPPPAAISAEISAAIASWWLLVRYPTEKLPAFGSDGLCPYVEAQTNKDSNGRCSYR